MSTAETANQNLNTADAAVYNTFAAASVDIADAHVSNGILSLTRRVRDVDGDKKRRLLYSIVLPSKDDDESINLPPIEINEKIKFRIPSPSGNKLAVVCEEEHNEKKTQVLEIWTNRGQSLFRRIALSDDVHGKIINDLAVFGGPSWSPDENVIVYPAERKAPKTASYFDVAGTDGKIMGGKHVLGIGKMEKWGEAFDTLTPLLDLFCVDVNSGKVLQVENVPSGVAVGTLGGYSLGQPVFSPDGKAIVYTGWDAGAGGEMPKRLGLIYCQQRSNKLYTSPVTKLLKKLSNEEELDSSDGDYECLTPENRISFSPRFASDTQLLYLASKQGFDTHFGCLALHSMDWDGSNPVAKSERVLVKEVGSPRDDSDGAEVAGMKFPGLVMLRLPTRGFTPGFLLASTQWGSIQKIVVVSLKDGSLRPLNFAIRGQPKDEFASQSLLCTTAEGGAVVLESAPNRPHVVGYMPPQAVASATANEEAIANPVGQMSAISTTCFSSVELSPMNLTYEILRLEYPPIDGVDVGSQLQCILLLPKDAPDDVKPPLIVVPHGGPHSVSSTMFIASYAYLCAYGGYAILFVNYRGSCGFGKNSIDFLTARIGNVDVADVVHATKKVAEMGIVDPSRIGICGGSHGGFLVGHCTGQHPELFKAAAMRNPVTNLPSMVTVTDIPDWCYVESLGYYNWKEFRGLSKEEVQTMWEKSPVAYSSQVVTPTLVALGGADLRVPPSQGLEWHYILRSKGVKTQLCLYPKDNHPIDRPASEADHWIKIKRWFDEHL